MMRESLGDFYFSVMNHVFSNVNIWNLISLSIFHTNVHFALGLYFDAIFAKKGIVSTNLSYA